MRTAALGTSALFFVAAGFLLVADDSMALKATAFAVFGVACVIAVSLVFLAIGRSEDEERAASQPKPPPPPDPHAGEAARRSRPRPPRRPT
jgi:multisubunit Na+/H+ antiporter MnhC subunit